MPDLELKEIEGVEIFASGTWNDDPYTLDDLDRIVKAFDATKESLKPYVKLGHGERQGLLRSDELPAAGWIERVYRSGNKLLADIKNMPIKIYELVKRKAYARVSSEIFTNIAINGVKYPLALKAVSLLGGETPAIHSLDDVLALFAQGAAKVAAFETDADIRRYEFEATGLLAIPQPQEVDPMTLEQLQQENAGLKEANKKFSDENKVLRESVEKIGKDTADVKAFADEVRAQNEQLKKDKRFAEATTKVNELIQSKKIVPAQKEALTALLLETDSTRKFSIGGKEYTGMEAVVLAFVEAGNAAVPPTEEESEVGKQNSQDLDGKVKNYQAKHKVSYAEALTAVAVENGVKSL